MKTARYATVAAVIELGVLAVLLHLNFKDFLWNHPWLHSFLVGLPAVGFGIVEWQHSGEANALRRENNDLHRQNNDLTRELDTARNMHLQQIAKNMEKEPTQAERNAAILRKHLRSRVAVMEGNGRWSIAPEIVEVTDDGLVKLFVPCGQGCTIASCVTVHSADVEIIEIPQGDCPIRLKILKRYGPEVQLGEIKKWEERNQPAAAESFVKGDSVYYTTYGKPGSSERRTLYVYRSKDGADHYMLEGSTGEKATGDRIKISKDFMAVDIDYRAAGFTRSSSGGGGALFVC